MDYITRIQLMTWKKIIISVLSLISTWLLIKP
ncbi:MAG: hypothetical protein RL220_2013 [Bacteroidota bacterium]|jgi:hypothetical protein